MQYCWGKCQEFWNCRNVISIWSEKSEQRFETSVLEDIPTLSVTIGNDHSIIRVFLVDHLAGLFTSKHDTFLHFFQMFAFSLYLSNCFWVIFMKRKETSWVKASFVLSWDAQTLRHINAHVLLRKTPAQYKPWSSQIFVFGISIQILWWGSGVVPDTDPHFCHYSVGQHIQVKHPFSLQTVHV